MEYQPVGLVNGINLADYVACEKGYNSIVYVHKSVLEKQRQKEQKTQDKKEQKAAKKMMNKLKKLKKKQEKENKEAITEKLDKSVQFDEDVYRHDIYFAAIQNDPALQQTIQMAKNIVPLVITRNGDEPTVCFTIKTKKSKKKTAQDMFEAKQDVMYKKERSKRIVETFKNDKMNQRESLSIRETVSISSNTLDEINFSPSSCSFSEISDKKHHRKEKTGHQPKNNSPSPRISKHISPSPRSKVVASDSVEALANRVNNSGDTKLKIHLMNEKDKNSLADNIRIPVLNAIRDCISEMVERHDYGHKGLESVYKFVQSNNEKLDGVLQKLSIIEQKLGSYTNDNKEVTVIKPPQTHAKTPRHNSSTLEQLGEDLNEEEDDSYREEERRRYEYERQKEIEKRKAKAQPMTPRIQIQTIDQGHDTGGYGEDQPGAAGHVAPIPERQSRVPARFCWTDTTRNP